MSRLDFFLDALIASLIVSLFILSLIVCFRIAPLLPLGLFAPVLLLVSGASISASITYYFCKGCKTE